MGSVVKTFLFDTDLEGWVLNGTGVTRSTVDGYPTFGSLQAYAYGLSLTYTGGATWAGNYNDLGVPVGAIITGINPRITEKISAWTTGGSVAWSLKYNAGATLLSSVDAALMAWSYRSLVTPITGLAIPSANSVDLAFSCVTKTGSKSTSAMTAYFDQIQLTITYYIPAPTFTTMAATAVTASSATLKIDVTSMGGVSSYSSYFQYRKIGDIDWIATTPVARTAIGIYSLIQALDWGSFNYEYRAVIDYTDDTPQTVYGNILSVVVPVLPTLVVNPATSVLYDRAALNANVTNMGTFTLINALHHARKVGEAPWFSFVGQSVNAPGAYSTFVVGLDFYRFDYEVRASGYVIIDGAAVWVYSASTLIVSYMDTGLVFIERSTGDNLNYTLIAVVEDVDTLNPVSYDDSSGLIDGVLYYYRARRHKHKVFSAYSTEVAVIFQDGIAAGFSSAAVTTGLEGLHAKVALGQSDTATIVATAEGSGVVVINTGPVGSSEITVFITSQSQGIKLARSPPSEASVTTLATGSYVPIKSGSSQTSVTVSQDGQAEKIGIAGSEVTIGANATGSGSASRQGSSETSIIVTSEGAGQATLSNGSTASVSVVPQGTGTPIKEGYSASVVSVASNGSGIAIKMDSSEASVLVATQGSGVAINLNYKEGSSWAQVQVQSSGAGSTVKIGHSQIDTYVVEQALGLKLASGESTGVVQANSVGEGRKVASGYSEATSSNVSALGSGVHTATRTSQVIVVTNAQGSGFAAKNGGSHYFVAVIPTGQGTKATSGSASAYVVVVTHSASYKVAVGSSNVYTSVLTQGSGERVIEVYSGGSEALISVTTEEAGLKLTEGASKSVIGIDTISTWETHREGSSDTTIIVASIGSGYNVPLPGVPVEIFLMPFDEVFKIDSDDLFTLPVETYVFIKLKEEDFMVVYDVDLVFVVPVEEHIFIVPKEDVFYAI